MAENLIEIKRRINSIESTKKITKAMKLVSSVKLKKWKDLFDNNYEYANLNICVIRKALSNIEFNSKNLPDVLKEFNSNKTLYIVVTSDLGLCGSYNYNIFKKLDPILSDEDELLLIGKKGYYHYKDFKGKIYDDFIGITDTFTYEDVKSIRHLIIRLYKTQQYKSVTILYTKYINSLNFEACFKRLIPLDYDVKTENVDNYSFKPIFEPDINTVLNTLLPHYVDSMIFQKLIEGSLCEYAERRNAMENATTNADEINEKLKTDYNKLRQSKITQEINEVVSGANAAKGD